MSDLKWYVLRVKTGREEAVKQAIDRLINAKSLGESIKEVIVPTERITEIKGGKRAVVEKKLYAGYVMIHMEMSESTWFEIKNIPGVGDFLGQSDPIPLQEHEAQKMVAMNTQSTDQIKPQVKLNFNIGDTVRVKEGPFINFEAQIKEVDEQKGIVTVVVTVFGRLTPLELEYWQLEKS